MRSSSGDKIRLCTVLFGDLSGGRACVVQAVWCVFSGGLGLTGGFFGRGAHHLLDPHRKGAPLCRINQGQTEKGQAGNHAAVHAGKEAIQSMRMMPSFADHHLIASQDVNCVWAM